MPNSFVRLDVPQADGPGIPFVTRGFGRPKTIAFDGSIPGRYVVEGSNDGGVTWDILVDDDGAQALFTNVTPGIRTFDCMVERVRVRSIGNGLVAQPPVVSLGAPPAKSPPIFGVLDVPAESGSGQPFDLGLSAGPFKTFILRGALSPGSRYTIFASLDGQRFDEVLLFTSDQQGARATEFLCRFLRVVRQAVGPTPVVSFGCEGSEEPGAAALPIAEAGEVGTTSGADEEVIRQYHVPLGLLPSAALAVTLTGESLQGPSESGRFTYRVRAGGTDDQPDGDVLLTADDGGASSGEIASTSSPFSRPSATSTLIKLTAQGNGSRALLRNFVLFFHA